MLWLPLLNYRVYGLCLYSLLSTQSSGFLNCVSDSFFFFKYVIDAVFSRYIRAEYKDGWNKCFVCVF